MNRGIARIGLYLKVSVFHIHSGAHERILHHVVEGCGKEGTHNTYGYGKDDHQGLAFSFRKVLDGKEHPGFHKLRFSFASSTSPRQRSQLSRSQEEAGSGYRPG